MDVDGGDVVRLTDTDGINVDPVWSPDGSQIAFLSNRDGEDHLYIMNDDGTDQRQLTFGTRGGVKPEFSADGKSLFYLSGGEGGPAITQMHLDDGWVRHIPTKVPVQNIHPTIESGILMFSNEESLFSLDLLSGEIRVVSNFPVPQLEWPAVSFDGKRLAFIEFFEYEVPPRSYGHLQIACLSNADGSNLRKLTHDFYEAVFPTFSADGNWLAFRGERNHADPGSLFIVPVTGDASDVRELMTYRGTIFSWGPERK